VDPDPTCDGAGAEDSTADPLPSIVGHGKFI
jgi:hypothetical protein